MNNFNLILGVFVAVGMLGWVFFLIFAKVTVRKLEKHPDTKEILGMEFVSGWRIFNIAKALVLPMAFFRFAEKGPLRFLYSDAEALRSHTNRIDKFFAHIFFWTFYPAGIGIIVLVLLQPWLLD